MNISFLLGAGASIPCPLPATPLITDAILTHRAVELDEHGNLILGNHLFDPNIGRGAGIEPKPAAEFNDYELQVIEFRRTALALVFDEIRSYYNRPDWRFERRDGHYEDIYYVLQQIWDDRSVTVDNPIVPAFVDRLNARPEAARLVELDPLPSDTLNWPHIASDLTHYMGDVLRWLLDPPWATDHSCYAAIADAARDPGVSRVDVLTLNNDLMVERMLEASGVEFDDGFPDGVWDPNSLDNPRTRVRLFKLHGSIDWLEGNGVPQLFNRNAPPDAPSLDRPVLLMGRFNKMIEYSSSVFPYLIGSLQRVLLEADAIVTSGFSFGDHAVNRQLVQSMWTNKEQALVLLHPEGADLLRAAPAHVHSSWESWVPCQLQDEPSFLSQVTWPEVLALITASKECSAHWLELRSGTGAGSGDNATPPPPAP